MEKATSNSESELKKYKKGDILFVEGEFPKNLYIIKTGRVRVFKEKNGKLIPVISNGPKEFVGELSLFTQSLKRGATGLITEDTELIEIERKGIQEVIRKCPEWVNELFKTVAERLRTAGTIIRENYIEDDEKQVGMPLKRDEEEIFVKKINEYRIKKSIPIPD